MTAKEAMEELDVMNKRHKLYTDSLSNEESAEHEECGGSNEA